jgi:hypothetical protein
MRKRVLAIPFFALSFLFASSALAAEPDLASMDWSIEATHNLAANPPADDVIKAFMGKLDGAGGDPQGICFAHFADLHHSGTLSLVVSEGDGRACYLSVVDKTAGGFRRYSFDLSRLGDRPEIKDLDENGKLELIVPTDLTGYQGAVYCMAQWPVIYACTGNGYSDVSSNYRSYYEKRLGSLKKEIEAAEANKEQAELGAGAHGTGRAASPATGAPASDKLGKAAPPEVVYGPNGSYGSFNLTLIQPSPVALPMATPEPDRRGLNCTKVEAAKIERFLGVSRDAGMTDAIKWADSADPIDREFASDVLADIGTPDALEYLRTLSNDSVRGVALNAKISLDQAIKGPAVHTVEEDSIALDAGTPSP